MKKIFLLLCASLLFLLPLQALAMDPLKNAFISRLVTSVMVTLRAASNNLWPQNNNNNAQDGELDANVLPFEEIIIEGPAPAQPLVYLFNEDYFVAADQAAGVRLANLARGSFIVRAMEGFEYTQNNEGTPIAELGGYAFGIEELHAIALLDAYTQFHFRLVDAEDVQGYLQSQFFDTIGYFVHPDFEAVRNYLYAVEALRNNGLLKFIKDNLVRLQEMSSLQRMTFLTYYYPRGNTLGTPAERLQFVRWFSSAQLQQHNTLFPEPNNRLPFEFRQSLNNNLRTSTAFDEAQFENMQQQFANWCDIFVVANIQKLRAYLDSQHINVPLVIIFGNRHLPSLRLKLAAAGFKINEDREALEQQLAKNK